MKDFTTHDNVIAALNKAINKDNTHHMVNILIRERDTLSISDRKALIFNALSNGSIDGAIHIVQNQIAATAASVTIENMRHIASAITHIPNIIANNMTDENIRFYSQKVADHICSEESVVKKDVQETSKIKIQR